MEDKASSFFKVTSKKSKVELEKNLIFHKVETTRSSYEPLHSRVFLCDLLLSSLNK